MHCTPHCSFLNLRKVCLNTNEAGYGTYQVKEEKEANTGNIFHIDQEIINKICVYHLLLWGKNKSSKIQKSLYLPKPKHSV